MRTALLITLASTLAIPPAPRSGVVEQIHGVEVADPFRPLEDLQSKETRQWIDGQKQLTGEFARQLPVEPIRERIAALQNFRRFWPPLQRGSRTFAVETAAAIGGTATNDVRVFLQEGSGELRPILTNAQLFPKDDFALQRFISPSPDGRHLAFSFARPSSRWLRWRILDVVTNELLPETIEGMHTTMAVAAWTPDSKGFVYGRFDAPATGAEMTTAVKNERLFLHRLLTPQSEDRLLLGEGSEEDRWFSPHVAEDGTLVVVSARGTAKDHEVFRMKLDGAATKLEGQSGTIAYLGSRGADLYFLADRSRIVRHAEGRWSDVVPASSEAIDHAALVADHFILASVKDAAPRFRIVSIDGTRTRPLEVPPGNVWGPPWGPGFVGQRSSPLVFFSVSGLADAGSIFSADPRTCRVSVWRRPDIDLDPERFETRHVLVPRGGGINVPMFIVHRKGMKLDGSHGVIMYGYGALAWSAYPWFQPQMVAWLERGGVFALPGTRGGGEYGERWHQAGIGRNRQNAIDDYIAAAQWLIANRYTSAKKIVASGSSLGAALPAAAVQQRPELFGAALIDIPVLDLVGYERHTGALMWRSELGSVRDAADFRALLAYSPLHNAAKSCGPPTLVTAGSRDETAVPSHAYKYVAALQARSGCKSPALLQVVEGAGHGYGTTPEQTAATLSLQLAFVERALSELAYGGAAKRVVR